MGRARSVAFGRTPVIQTPKLGAQIMRYELAENLPMSDIAGLGLILSCQHAVSLLQVLAYLPI